MIIRLFNEQDTQALIDLWDRCDLLRPWNDPAKDIQRKCAYQPELFFVGEWESRLVASAMLGYDGHRGSLYYLAICPEQQGAGYGTTLMRFAEEKLLALGCPKINVFVRNSNLAASRFYEKLDYSTDEAIALSKRLIEDQAVESQ